MIGRLYNLRPWDMELLTSRELAAISADVHRLAEASKRTS